MKAIFNALFWVIRIVGLCVLAVFGSTAAFAQTSQCAPALTLRTALAATYGEVPLWVGLNDAGVQFTLFANAQSGTWTFIGVQNDTGCMLASGTGYAAGDGIPPILPPPSGEEG
jgi:hypothetical protein